MAWERKLAPGSSWGFLLYGTARMTKMAMVEQAIKALGEASPANILEFVQKEYGEAIEPRYMPIFLASIRGKRHLEIARRERAVVPKVEVEQQV